MSRGRGAPDWLMCGQPKSTTPRKSVGNRGGGREAAVRCGGEDDMAANPKYLGFAYSFGRAEDRFQDCAYLGIHVSPPIPSSGPGAPLDRARRSAAQRYSRPSSVAGRVQRYVMASFPPNPSLKKFTASNCSLVFPEYQPPKS